MKLLPKYASRFDFGWSEQDEALAKAFRASVGIAERPEPVKSVRERDRGWGGWTRTRKFRDSNLGGS